jgi:dipeptidyl aminopeptidase/acylaminoacyl peptidase
MSRHQRALRFVCMAVTCGLLAGCAVHKTVTIRTDPLAATVYLDGQPGGITPVTTTLTFDPKTKAFEITAKKEGFKDGTTTIYYKPKDQTQYDIKLEKIEAIPIPMVTVEPTPTEKGVKLQLARRPVLAYLEVIERSPNVASVTRVTNNEDKGLQIGGPVLSPAEDILLYTELVEENSGSYYSNIQKQPVGSFGRTRLTYGKWHDLFPSFTADGSNVVFSSNRTSSNPTLWRVKTDGAGGITKLTSTQAEDFAPNAAPDGKLVAYASNPPDAEETQIWTIPWEASLSTQLREGQNPQVSPDGNRILFFRVDKITKKKQLWVMNIDGTGETQLTQNTDYDTAEPRWSPNGKWIVFASDEGFDSHQNRNSDIWLMAADGSKRTQLTTNGSRDDSPCWDRKGEYIYFRSNRGGAWNIWRFKPLLPSE